MKYVSTRGHAPVLPFDEVLLAGLATDGGLYVPESWPDLRPALEAVVADPSRPYVETAIDVMAPFVGDALPPAELRTIVTEAYSTFDHPEVAPVRRLEDDVWLLELFWGPTLAFKDLALQVVGRLFDHVLAARGDRVTIVGATSGDTGSAAIEACRDRDAVDIFILHPHGRVSEVQRRQMTTVLSPNVFNLAIDGTFDDCQDLVKAMFADEPFRSDVHLSAVNSINWARVMAQVVYYVTTTARVGRGGPVAFSVPTGNFGNVFAAEVARRGGIPISQLVIASNRNDILTRLFRTGSMTIEAVVPTLSPAMDIQISSNLERLLFELYDRDGEAVAGLLAAFREDGTITIPPERLGPISELVSVARVDDEQTKATIGAVRDRTGVTIDPHTAVGVAAAAQCRRDLTVPMVCVATAHPAKFPDAVEAATGERPQLPARLADLGERPERYERLAADLATVEAYVEQHSRVVRR